MYNIEYSEARISYNEEWNWYACRRSTEFVKSFNLERYGWRFFFRHNGCE